jgi:RNA polymerase sigma-70 factor (ECF subfamily)
MQNPTATLPALRAWPFSPPIARRLHAEPVDRPGRTAAAERTAATPPSEDPEQAWVARARRGDAEAFRLLVERHRHQAYAVARRIVRSEPDAEEVAQDAFVRAWRALPEFRGEARFGTWLHAIVVRRALDRAELLGRRRGRELQVEALPESPDSAPDHEAALRARRLDGLMGSLSDIQRAAVTLYYYEDRSVEHVATALGLPENTVKTHLSRARAALREAWLGAGERA